MILKCESCIESWKFNQNLLWSLKPCLFKNDTQMWKLHRKLNFPNIFWLPAIYIYTWTPAFQYEIVTFMRWYRNRTILWAALVFHLCVFLPCDVTSWILTTACNTWQLSTTRYDNRVRWLFPRSHGIEKFVIWFTEDIICFAFATPLIY